MCAREGKRESGGRAREGAKGSEPVEGRVESLKEGRSLGGIGGGGLPVAALDDSFARWCPTKQWLGNGSGGLFPSPPASLSKSLSFPAPPLPPPLSLSRGSCCCRRLGRGVQRSGAVLPRGPRRRRVSDSHPPSCPSGRNSGEGGGVGGAAGVRRPERFFRAGRSEGEFSS
jgi:hypothetical protein